MAVLSVWRYETPEAAHQASRTLAVLTGRETLEIHASATVSWQRGQSKPRTTYDEAAAGPYPLGGSFWGLLFGLVFYVPLLGAALGTATGAVTGSLVDVGIDDTFVNRLRDNVTPGTSALFLLTSDETVALLREVFADQRSPEIFLATLSAAQESALRAVFAD